MGLRLEWGRSQFLFFKFFFILRLWKKGFFLTILRKHLISPIPMLLPVLLLLVVLFLAAERAGDTCLIGDLSSILGSDLT